LRERVRAVAAGVLKMRPGEIDNQKDLAGYGYDSISFTELATGINAAFGVELTPAVFFELEPPSIFTIAEYLERSCCVMGESTSAAATAPPEKSALAEAFAPAFAPTDDAIAIIGVSGKMPGAEGLKAFWENLDAGVSSVRTIPSARWAWQDYHGGPKTPNKSVSKCGAFVDDVDRFDAAFFGMTASDARLVDPQQRIVLESVWSAIEDAGYAPATLSNSRTAVYVGVTNRDYLDVLDMAKVGVHATSTFGNEPTFLVNRVSYLLNLHGASEPVNTLCSSSLVAIHKAVAELKSGACHLAIAGGVSVIASPRMDIVFSEAGMLSATGGCRSFAKDADGFVRGEGVGILVLKRLRDAERDGDPIHAIVCATGINHGGHANSPTSPNGKAQVDLVRETYERHDVDPRTIQMLEAHGTGTQLGDAVELNSVTRAFRELCAERGGAVPEQPYCAVTCVKTNIGHLEAAAGIAAVLKAILAIRHRRIPALAAHGEPNSYIDLRNAPFYLATKAEDWRAPTDADGQQLPRRAAVSSFGASGANAHVVIEEYVRAPRAPEKRDGGVHVIALSARDDAALERYASSLRRFVQEAMVTKGSDVRLADIAYTLQTGRAPMSHRLAIVAESLEQLERALSRPIDANHVERRYRGVAATVRDDQSAGALGMDPEAMAQAWVRGEDVGWRERQLEHGVWRIALPTYPFERTRHWAEPPTVKAFDEAHYREVLERLRDGEKSASSILMSATETES
jgi:acyl transferase domain-containing protein/acyl carrier protein